MWNINRKQLNNLWEEDVYYLRTVTSWISRWRLRVRTPIVLNLSVFALLGVVGLYVLFPTIANADMEHEHIGLDGETVALIIEQMKNETRPYGRLPESENASPRRTYKVPVTAYTSEVGQTDESPCITASGLDVCQRNLENVVAANFLPIGTRVRIPELYGNQVFYVEDRMNERYHYKMDIWMKEKAAAKQFGVKYATIEVF